MSYMKDLDIRIRSGGDDAIAAACELMPRWIPVSERLPEEDSVVLAFMPEGSELKPEVREMYFVEGEWMNDRGHWPEVTHWMPLPEPPETNT